MPSLNVTHPVYEGSYLILDSHTELVGLAFFLPVVNLHEVLGDTQSKQQYIFYGNELVGFYKPCSAICGHARNLEAIL